MERKYSVIIPVYDSENTINRCIESLLLQKRDDAEIIVIDDGSRDKSAEILAEYAEDNDNVILISQENSGVSAARNAGIEKASGTYITFVDSDDFVSEDYFSALDQMGAQADDDFLMFASNTVGGKEADESDLYHQLESLESRNKKMELLLSSRKIMSPINKRFKRDIIQRNNIRFIKDLQTGEDFNFCLGYMLCCNTVCVRYKKIYNVDVSDNTSLSRKYRSHLDVQLEKAFKNAAKLLKKSTLSEEEKGKLLKIIDYLYVKNIFTCIAEEFKKEKPIYRKARREIAEIYKRFSEPLCRKGAYCNIIHRILRTFVKCECILPIYGVTKVVKGKQFIKYVEK